LFSEYTSNYENYLLKGNRLRPYSSSISSAKEPQSYDTVLRGIEPYYGPTGVDLQVRLGLP